MGADDLGPEAGAPPAEARIETPQDFLKHLRDPELSEALLHRYHDEQDFRRQFEVEITGIIREEAKRRAYLLPSEDVNRTMGLFTGKSPYQRAAEEILHEEGKIQVVVFGHTHYPINGNHPPVELPTDVAGKYFNSGSWTSSVDLDHPQNQGSSFDELCQSDVRKETLDYVEVTIASDGRVQAVLGRA